MRLEAAHFPIKNPFPSKLYMFSASILNFSALACSCYSIVSRLQFPQSVHVATYPGGRSYPSLVRSESRPCRRDRDGPRRRPDCIDIYHIRCRTGMGGRGMTRGSQGRTRSGRNARSDAYCPQADGIYLSLELVSLTESSRPMHPNIGL